MKHSAFLLFKSQKLTEDYLSPKSSFLDLVDPFVRMLAFLFLPEVDFLRSRMNSSFFVFEAMVFLPYACLRHGPVN